MKRLWLTVEEAFAARGRGVLLEPKFAPENAPKGTFSIRLELPTGEERTLSASLDFAHSRGALAPFAMVRAFDVTPEEIPKGSKIWFDE